MRFKSLLVGLLSSFVLFSTVPSYALTVIFNNLTNENIQYFTITNTMSNSGVQSAQVKAFRNRMLPNNLSQRLIASNDTVMFKVAGLEEMQSCGVVRFHYGLTAIGITETNNHFICNITSR